MSEVVPASALLIFARELVKQIPKLKEKYGIDVPQLYEALKPVLLQKLKEAGIAIRGAVASVVQEGGKLIYCLAASPLFWVCLTAGAAVLTQLGLEYLGRPEAGRAVGALGIAAAGGLAGFFFAPAVIPVAAGALMGFGAWSAVDKLRGITSELIKNYSSRGEQNNSSRGEQNNSSRGEQNNRIRLELTIHVANAQPV